MATRIKLTRPELKRQRDALTRFERYLPMLKLKQQQLQKVMGQIREKLNRLNRAAQQAREAFGRYSAVLADPAGMDVVGIASPTQVRTGVANVAGLSLPVFEEAVFTTPRYGLFSTPAWVDATIADLRKINRIEAEMSVVNEQYDLLSGELTKIVQRVNLFEKIKIPQTREAIRRIRIRLGDEMTAGVGRAKIAKSKLAETESGGNEAPDEPRQGGDAQ